MKNHAQLLAHDIRGPISQLLTNLSGESGDKWLVGLNQFLRKKNPWLDKISIESLPMKWDVISILSDAGIKNADDLANMPYHELKKLLGEEAKHAYGSLKDIQAK